MSVDTEELATLYAEDHSQTAEMHPKDIVPEATAPECIYHPEIDSGFTIGLGYAGGGFGSYKRCRTCRRVYAKTKVKDGNDA